jgi:excisionase family DNA binding protein
MRGGAELTDTILNLEDVAKMLKVSERTVQREVTAGKLKAFKVGRSLRFRLGEVEKYIERQEVSPGETTESNGDEDEDAA